MSKQLKNKDLARTLTSASSGQSSVNVGEPNLDAFADRMKLLIKHFKSNGGVAEIARKCGFSEAVIRSWRDGGSDPSRLRCIQLADGTGASLLWLVAGEGEMWAVNATEPALQSGSQDLSEANLNIALEYTDDIIRATRATYVPRSLYAKLLRLMYEGVTRGLPLAEIHDLGQQLVRAVISGTGEQGNGSQSGLDGPSQGSR